MSTFESTRFGPRSTAGGVTIRAVEEAGVRYLYELATREDISYRWRFRGEVPTFEVFAATFYDGCLTQAVAVDSDSLRPFGHMMMYNADLRNMVAFLGSVVNPDRVGHHRGAIASLLFVNHVLARWPLRKIYVEIPEFTFRAIHEYMAIDLGERIVEEGCLRDYTYFNGRYWDMHLCSIDRFAWAAMTARELGSCETEWLLDIDEVHDPLRNPSGRQ